MADRSGGDESVSTTADRESADDADGDPISDTDPLPDDLDDAGVDEAV
jgi:hypothetical protein